MEQFIRTIRKFSNWGSTKNDNRRRLIIVLAVFGVILSFVESRLISNPIHLTLLYSLMGISTISLILAYRNVLWPGQIVATIFGFILVTMIVADQGIQDESIGGYYLLLMVVGLLLGDTGSILFGSMSTVAIAIIGYLGIIKVLPHTSDLEDVISASLMMFGTTCILHSIVVQLYKEAEKAHLNEQEQLSANAKLRQLQAELEQRVADRTMELQSANQEMSNQLDQIRELRTKLEEQAIRDPLTGLYNRRYLEETLIREFAHARREDYDISFMLLDIDHFKKFNDLYGHATGDVAIKTVAKQLTSRARTAGIPCRMGGEEFLLVMPGILDEVAQLRAEYFRDQVMATPIPYGDQNLTLTVSIGIASFPKNGETWEELYEAVDQALYRAKQNGRNRVECA